MLQLACVQAANETTGIKHVYVTLTSLWKFFDYFPKRAESLRDVQRILDLPELKVIKPSRWLAQERCVKGVKASYTAIVAALENMHETSHEPEVLGLSNVLSTWKTTAAIFLLDYTLLQVAKLYIQTEHLDLPIPSLVDATLHILSNAILPTANWVLELLDERENLEQVIGQEITKPFIAHLKNNISSRFTSFGDILLLALSIFDPRKLPSVNFEDLSSDGETAIDTLHKQ